MRTITKKRFNIIIIFILMFSLFTGCTSNDSDPNKTTLTYIGHSSVKIKSKDGTVIYIDPNYYLGDYSDKADYLLITHGHEDHQPSPKLEQNENCTVITYKEALIDGEYSTFEYGEIKIQAVPSGGNYKHKIENCVGYIVTVDGFTFYHAGDTSMMEKTQEIADKDIIIHYAMYPIDGDYNMDAVEATEVANLIGAKNNIPIHEYDRADIKKSDKFTPEGRLVLEYGETIVIE